MRLHSLLHGQATETSSDAQSEEFQLLIEISTILEGLDSIGVGLLPWPVFRTRRLLDFPERSSASSEMSDIVAGICKLRSSHFGSRGIDLMP